MDTIWRDIRVAIRSLGRAPGFAVATILTLAIGIGAITAMYTVVEAVLLRDLPYANPDRVVRVAATTLPQAGGSGAAPFSDRGYWHFVENNRSFDAFGGFRGQVVQIPLTGDDAIPVQAAVSLMTLSAFEILGVQPLRGRLPTAEEDAPGGAQVALVSQELWASRWGSDPSLVGRTIDLNGQSMEVIGVMPANFDFPSPETQIWRPYRLDPASENFGGHHIEGLARLSAGASIESAEADAKSLVGRFEEVGYNAAWFTGVFDGGARVWTLEEEVVGEARQPLWILFGSVVFVLLVACSNVANLLLVRAESRVGESAVRLALGSGRGRIVRQVITESLVLALAGGLAGAFIGWMSVRLLVAAAPASLPRLDEIAVSPTVLAFTAGVAVLAGLLFGLLPALRLGSPSSLAALREGGRGGAIGGGRHRTRSALVVAQVALALMLLVGSGLMMRTFQQLRSVDPGFDVAGALTFEARPIPAKYGNAEGLAQLFDRLRERIGALPGVAAVGGINALPLAAEGAILTTVIDEFPPAEGEFPPTFHVRRVSPGYFEAMGIPIVEGRSYTDDDNRLRLGSLIISDNVKQQYWPETSALGKRITVAGVPARVVGVAGNVHSTSLEVEPEQVMYLPMLDSAGGGVGALTMVARTQGDPLSIVTSVRQAVAEVDPELPIANVRTLDNVVSDSVSRTSFTMVLLILGAAVALFLGCVGIYGVISYIVVQRTTEIGVRMALGDDPPGVLRLVLSQGMILTAAGLALGLIAIIAVGNVLSSLLYGVSRFDPLTLAGGVVVFLVVSTVATLIPAWRASRIPPSEALRPQ